MNKDLTLVYERTDEKGIIYPVKGKREPHLGPDALMVMIPSELQYLVRIVKAQQIPSIHSNLHRFYQAMVVGKRPPLVLSGPFLGAPHAVMAMEKLIVLGVRRIWVLGWCGSLQPDLRIGDLIIPTGAVSEEGTSAHYPINHREPESNARLNQRLEGRLRECGLPFSKGKVWTTDAVYRETPKKVETYKSQGVLAVEMEISALMTVSVYRGAAMAALLVVSDELFDLTWLHGFSNPLLKKNSRRAGEVLLDLAGSFSKARGQQIG